MTADNDTALTDEEFEVLRDAGYRPSGGGILDGRAFLRFSRGGEQRTGSRAEWRAVIAGLRRAPIEDEARRLRDGLGALLDCLDNIECDCLDPPEDRAEGGGRGTDPDDPSAHAQYCPVYLRAYITALLNGGSLPE